MSIAAIRRQLKLTREQNELLMRELARSEAFERDVQRRPDEIMEKFQRENADRQD